MLHMTYFMTLYPSSHVATSKKTHNAKGIFRRSGAADNICFASLHPLLQQNAQLACHSQKLFSRST